jgi:spore germination protein GerM
VQDGTAILNFSDELQFGTYGVEGYRGSVQQIVWTATEFPTIKNVQILIHGRLVNYLGESVRIGLPLSRENL